MLVFLWEKKHASPVTDSRFSFTFLFVFVLKSLSLLFTSRYAMEAFFLYLLIFFYLIPQFAKHSVRITMNPSFVLVLKSERCIDTLYCQKYWVAPF